MTTTRAKTKAKPAAATDDAAQTQTAWAHEQSNDPDPGALDAFSAYVREIARYPLLSAEEERALFQRLAEHPDDAEAAQIRERIFTANLRLVVAAVRQRRHLLRAGGAVTVMDLVQEGNLGLHHAIGKFDYRLGYKLSTYAMRWIVQHVLRAVEGDRSPVWVPAYVQETSRAIERETAALTVQLGREPTAAEKRLAARGVQARIGAQTARSATDEALAAAERVSGVCSLDAPLRRHGTGGTDADPVTLADLLVDDGNSGESGGGSGGGGSESALFAGVLDAASEAQLATLVARCCTPRECQVIGLRYGHGMTLQEAGGVLHVSRERIRQIEAGAMTKLRTRLVEDRVTGGAVLRETAASPAPVAVVAPEPVVSISSPVESYRDRIFRLLDANPAASLRDLQYAASVCPDTACKYAKAWRRERERAVATAPDAKGAA